MYLKKVEAVVEIRTVDKYLLRRKIYQICIKISKDVFKPIKNPLIFKVMLYKTQYAVVLIPYFMQ